MTKSFVYYSNSSFLPPSTDIHCFACCLVAFNHFLIFFFTFLISFLLTEITLLILYKMDLFMHIICLLWSDLLDTERLFWTIEEIECKMRVHEQTETLQSYDILVHRAWNRQYDPFMVQIFCPLFCVLLLLSNNGQSWWTLLYGTVQYCSYQLSIFRLQSLQKICKQVPCNDIPSPSDVSLNLEKLCDHRNPFIFSGDSSF